MSDGEVFFNSGQATLYRADCIKWLEEREVEQFSAVVTDPPYGIVEYSAVEQSKLREGRGGVWRIPPSFDGHQRAPIPRFTTLGEPELLSLREFFVKFGTVLLPTLKPGAHIFLASNPLVSYIVAGAMVEAGLERRGEVIRLVQTMRGGDRPKNAHDEYPEVSVMPRSQWEPWLLFRKPSGLTVRDTLRKYGTGGLRRISGERPFGDVIRSAPTGAAERLLAGHPSLKPQNFLRQIVRASLPTGSGIVLDPFAGSGSTLAAANFVGYDSTGVELDPHYYSIAKKAIPALSAYRNGVPPPWDS